MSEFAIGDFAQTKDDKRVGQIVRIGDDNGNDSVLLREFVWAQNTVARKTSTREELFEVPRRFESKVTNLKKIIVTFGFSETNPHFRFKFYPALEMFELASPSAEVETRPGCQKNREDYRLVRNFVLNAEAKNQLRILSDVISDDPKSLPSSLSCRDSDKTRRFTTPEDSKEGSSSRTSCPDSDKVGRFTSSEDSEEGSSSRTSCRDSCDAELLRTSSSQDVKESEDSIQNKDSRSSIETIDVLSDSDEHEDESCHFLTFDSPNNDVDDALDADDTDLKMEAQEEEHELTPDKDKNPEPPMTLRPRNKNRRDRADFADINDHNIFCDICFVEFKDGCPVHTKFMTCHEAKDLIVVKNSTIPCAGLGVFNNSTITFQVGTVFGPFEGLLLEDEEETTGKGFFWEIQNPEKTQVVGFVDPGPNPDIVTQWLAYVNCPMDEKDQNLLAMQYRGQIYYRVCCAVPPGAEMFVYYGHGYADELGILRFEGLDCDVNFKEDKKKRKDDKSFYPNPPTKRTKTKK